MRLYDMNTSLTNPEKIKTTANQLKPYLTELADRRSSTKYNFPESSILLPNDDQVLTNIEATVQSYDHPDLAAVVVIGIGGSSLGTQTVYDALKHRAVKRPLFFIETLDPVLIRDVQKQLEVIYQSNQHALLIVISKSGTTTETIANYGAMVGWFEKLDPNANEHTLIITEKNSKLWRYATDHELTTHAHEPIGGRYSVFSSVGLIPLGFAGVDITRLRAGARQALESGLSTDLHINHALTSAAAIYNNLQDGRTIHNTFVFAPQLATFGRWYAQLVGESLGKNGRGIMPLTSIGTTDLHSTTQLFLDGPDDKFTTFISNKNPDLDLPVSNQHHLGRLVADIEGHQLSQITAAILHGVKTAYQKRRRPYVEIELEQIDEENLGALLQTKMLEVMFLARLLDVNAFDQPAVEKYKEETRRILSRR